jgi:hypothetical protein
MAKCLPITGHKTIAAGPPPMPGQRRRGLKERDCERGYRRQKDQSLHVWLPSMQIPAPCIIKQEPPRDNVLRQTLFIEELCDLSRSH